MSLLKRIEQGQGKPTDQPSGNNVSGGDASRLSSLQARSVSAPSAAPQAGTYCHLNTSVQNQLLAELDPSMDITKTEEVRKTIQSLFEQILSEENIVLSRPERARLFEQISAEILGLGPLQPLLEDETVTEIMVNGSKNIYIERKGKIHRVPVTFESNEHVMRIIDRIVAPLGRRIDEASPYVDARLLMVCVNAVILHFSGGTNADHRSFKSRSRSAVDQFGTLHGSIQFLKPVLNLASILSSPVALVREKRPCLMFSQVSFQVMNGS
jgi:pilus assembly protein CpaF